MTLQLKVYMYENYVILFFFYLGARGGVGGVGGGEV